MRDRMRMRRGQGGQPFPTAILILKHSWGALTEKRPGRFYRRNTGAAEPPPWLEAVRSNGGGGGSRTPVRKAQRHEAYMLIPIRCAARLLRAFRAFARHAQNEQETQPASPMNLARTLRTERSGPAHCVTPLTGPMSKARGSGNLIN